MNHNNKATDYVSNPDVKNDLDGVTLEIKENTVSDKGLTLIIKNATPIEYTYSEVYCVEEKTDGGWRRLITRDIVDKNEQCWKTGGYTLGENNTQEQEIDWTWLYGKLNSGTYRIIKDFFVFTSSNEWHGPFSISATFTIN
jgi:hypothetical protein